MFSVHQCPGFKSQEATNEVNSELWAALSLVYSQDVQAFTGKMKERYKEENRGVGRIGDARRLIEERRGEEISRGEEMRGEEKRREGEEGKGVVKMRKDRRRMKWIREFCFQCIPVQCSFPLIDVVSPIKSLISDWIH